jgi:hypothetical protein
MKNKSPLDVILENAKQGADVGELPDTALRSILDSRYSRQGADRLREDVRIKAKIAAGQEALDRGYGDPDEIHARLASVQATVRAVSWCLHELSKKDSGVAVQQWCRNRARDIVTALAKNNQISSAHERIGEERVAEYVAREIRRVLPAWIDRAPSTIERYIKHELQRHVADGIRQRQK